MVVFCSFFPSTGFSQGKGHGVSIRPPDSKFIEAQPPEIVTTPFLVTNKTAETREFIEEIILPESWERIAQDFPFRLDSGENDLRLISFHIPITSIAGRYQVSYRVKDPRNLQINDEESVYVVVLPVIQIKIEIVEIPQRVIAGNAYHATFQVLSRSNAKTDVDLILDSSDGFSASAEPSKFSLEPGEGKLIHVTVKTDEDTSRVLRHRLKMKAKAQNQNKTVTASSSIQVEVIPRITGKGDPYHKIPSRIKTSWGNEDGKNNQQIELSGRGFLDRAKTKEIDFLFRQPLDEKEILFGFQEEYRVSFQGEKTEFHLGDRGYGLSPLTEQFRFGRGFEAGYDLDPFRFGAYYMETHLEKPSQTHLGSSVSYHSSPKWGLDLNFLKKKRTNEEDDLLSLQTFLKPIPSATLNLEFGSGWKTEDGKDDSDFAWHARLRGKAWGKINYSLEKLHSGPNYPGFYSDIAFTRFSLRFPIWKQFRFRASFSQDNNNLDVVSIRSSAPREKRYRMGIDYRLPFSTRLSFGYERDERRDILSPSDFNNVAEGPTFSIGHSFKKISLQANTRLLHVNDKIINEEQTRLTYRGEAQFRPIRGQHYSAFYTQGPQGLTADPRIEKNVGLSASYDFLDNHLRFELRYERRGINSADNASEQVLGNLRYEFLNGHLITLESRHLRFLDNDSDNTTTLLFSYSKRFGLPVSRRKDIGVVYGKIYDAEDPLNAGIPDAIVYLGGATAVTDSKGKFLFPVVNSGSTFLWVESTSLGRGKVTKLKTPLKINIQGGIEKEMNLGVSRSAALSIKVTLFKPSEGIGIVLNTTDGKKVVEVGGYPGLTIEFLRSDERIRRATGPKGHLTVRNLRPGKWKLIIPDQKIPKLHYIEPKQIEFELSPGQKKEVSIRILPIFRKMIFLDDDE